MDAPHQHPPEGACLPGCPAWAEGALHLFALQHRYRDMLEACRMAEVVQSVDVAPGEQGVELPEHLSELDLVRLNLAADHGAPELLLDEWGIRCTLTLRGRRFDCALPWPSVKAGVLRPSKKRLRFQVIEGGKKEE